MSRSRWAAGLATALIVCTPRPLAGGQATQTIPQRVFELRVDGEIDPIMAEYVDGAIARANLNNAALVLITIDTPGGLDTSMRDIIQHILDSRAPVAVYVAPPGARAASAGFFILLSADVAAMAPGTHTGAASPLLTIGGYPVTANETLKSKILNDATAYLRSYAARRGRNVALAETAITAAKAFTEREAADGHLCDLVASSHDALLEALNGRQIVRFDGSTTELVLTHPETVAIEMTGRQRLLARLIDPNIVFILLIAGVFGLYVEFTHPGLYAPGVFGGIALLIALFGMQILPINVAGLLLICVGFALFILEASYAGHGVLGLGGAVAMLFGAMLLVPSPLTGGGVNLGIAVGVTLPFAIVAVVLMRLVLRAQARRPKTGVEQLMSETGDVREAITAGAAGEKRGLVSVRGELWRAVASRPIPKGTRVRVVDVDGLTLHVEPLDDDSPAS